MPQALSLPKEIRSFIWQQGFAIGSIQIQTLVEQFMLQMEQGKQKQSSLAMLPSFLHVPEQLHKNEPVIVMDAGGSNLRCAIAKLKQNKQGYALALEQEKFLSMPGSREAITKDSFFELLYQSIQNLLPFSNTIGLCFSYPCEISDEHDGKLIRWTKEVAAEGVEGLWIAEELNKVIKKQHGQAKKIVLLNDTVACLLAGTMHTIRKENQTHYIGFILGTGTNCAYSETKDRQIINIESGAFDGITNTPADKLLDSQCQDQGYYLFEKKISGRYLGNLCLMLLQIASSKKLFSDEACKNILDFSNQENASLSTETLNALLENQFSALVFNEQDFEKIHFLIDSVIERAALLSAIQLAAISRYQLLSQEHKQQSTNCTICVEGSTYYQLRNYQERIRHYLHGINHAYGIQYEFVRMEFASLAGAALAALQVK